MATIETFIKRHTVLTYCVLAFAVFRDGQAQRIVEEGAIGAAISLALLAGALALPHAFT